MKKDEEIREAKELKAENTELLKAIDEMIEDREEFCDRMEQAEAENKRLINQHTILSHDIAVSEAENKKLREALDYYSNLIICHAGSCPKCIEIATHIRNLKDGE